MSVLPAWSEPRTAIVTGGGSGIGLAISHRLALEGAAVAVLDRDGDAAASAAKEIGAAMGKAMGLTVDVTDRPGIDAAVAGATSAGGGASQEAAARSGVVWTGGTGGGSA